MRTSTTVEDVLGVEKLLVDARYHGAAALALEAGEPVPDRRDPCFFDPRHGPSAQDIPWSPPVGTARTVPVCPDDAQRLRAGEEPLTRMIRVGDRYLPVHEVGGYQGVLDHQDRLYDEQSMSHDSYKHLAQVELWAPGTRFGGGDGVEGGSRSNSTG